MTRSRLTPEARRRQLVTVGAEMFATRPYESVLMEEVAERAGVSRALLYKYFANKRDLFAAVYQEASEGLLDHTVFDPQAPFLEQVVAALDVHFDYFAANRSAVLAANQALAGDPVIQAIIDGELGTLRHRVVALVAHDPHTRELLSSIMKAWLLFVRVLVIEWLDRASVTRTELRDISVSTLVAALGNQGVEIQLRS
jgi:AcrR family transcriptional regulator